MRFDSAGPSSRVQERRTDTGGLALLAAGWHVWEATPRRWPEMLGPQWDELVASLDGCVTQTAGWTEYALATDYRRAVLVAGMSADGSPQAVALGFITEPRWPLHGFRAMRFPAYPATGGNEAVLREALRVCERAAREYGCISIEFIGIGQLDATRAVEPLGYTAQRRLEYVFDLTQGEEALWNGVKRQHRKNVRRSAREEVRVVRMESLESAQVLRSLQEQVARRRAAKGEGFGLRPPEAYEALFRALVARGLGRVYCSYVGGTAVSAALFLTFGRRALSLYSGSSEQGLAAYGEYGLYWQALSDLAKEGYAELQLGSADLSVEDPASPAHGLHEFKLGFGAQTRRVVAASKTLRPAALRLYSALQQARSRMARGRGPAWPTHAGVGT